jgi:hypothetical protein
MDKNIGILSVLSFRQCLPQVAINFNVHFMIRHILLIQFIDNVTPQQIEEVQALFAGIPDKVEGVVATEWGTNDSPEDKNKNFTHAVLMTFADEAGRLNYLPHPEHDALRAVFKPLVKDVIVLDYQTPEPSHTFSK